jgi:carbonic anhydrase
VVVVLGHEGCGAVSAVLEGASGSDSLETILADIRPAIAAAQERGGQVLDTAVRQNVMNAASALPARSVVLRSRLESGDLLIVPLCYRLESGRVERLEF